VARDRRADFMVGAKIVGVPLLLKNLVDTMNIKATDQKALLVVPVALLLVTACCACRRRCYRIAWCLPGNGGRVAAYLAEVFRHLHALSLRFPPERQRAA
jgi:ATP-binding cassette subfamily B protein